VVKANLGSSATVAHESLVVRVMDSVLPKLHQKPTLHARISKPS